MSVAPPYRFWRVAGGTSLARPAWRLGERCRCCTTLGQQRTLNSVSVAQDE